MRPDANLAPIELAPGQAKEIGVPLDRILGLQPRLYWVFFRLNPEQESFTHWLRIRTPWQAKIAALRETPGWTPFLRSVLRGEQEGDPDWAVRELRWMGPPKAAEASPDLYAAYRRGNAELRASLVNALPWIDQRVDPNIELITLALADQDQRVRIGALRALRSMRCKSCWEGQADKILVAIFSLLWVEDRDTRVAAAGALAAFPGNPDVEAILNLLMDSDPDEAVRRQAHYAWRLHSYSK